ncbi:MAG: hypothetical protein ACR2P8_02185 [Myxococcota bacterium]
MRLTWVRGGAALVGLALASGCASTQTVDLRCVPNEVTVYVDGRKLEGRPETVELRQDQAHKIFFKGGAYEPQMVVLESVETDGVSRLEPTDLCTETRFVKMRPEVEVHVDPADEPLPAPES